MHQINYHRHFYNNQTECKKKIGMEIWDGNSEWKFAIRLTGSCLFTAGKNSCGFHCREIINFFFVSWSSRGREEESWRGGGAKFLCFFFLFVPSHYDFSSRIRGVDCIRGRCRVHLFALIFFLALILLQLAFIFCAVFGVFFRERWVFEKFF